MRELIKNRNSLCGPVSVSSVVDGATVYSRNRNLRATIALMILFCKHSSNHVTF